MVRTAAVRWHRASPHGPRGRGPARDDPARLHGRPDGGEGVLRTSARAVRRGPADHHLRPLLARSGRRDEADGDRGHLPRRLGHLGEGLRPRRIPGPDLASYPLSQVPDEAAGLVRALLTADKNQHFARTQMDEEQRRATPRDRLPPVHHRRRRHRPWRRRPRSEPDPSLRRGRACPGYHIEDQKPGAKKCGHQGGKVLVGQDEQNKRLNAARLQLDIMRVPGIIVARTDAESATFLDGRTDERDQPFILGATNLDLPSYRVGFLAILKTLHDLGLEEIRGHLLFAIPRRGVRRLPRVARTRRARAGSSSGRPRDYAEAGAGAAVDAVLDAIETGTPRSGRPRPDSRPTAKPSPTSSSSGRTRASSST